MTREQAVKWLKEALRQTDFQCEQMETAVEMAISALEQSNCDDCKYKIFTNLYFHTDPEMAEQEPCETSTDEPMTMVYPTIFCDDAISREAVINICKHDNCWNCAFCDKDVIDKNTVNATCMFEQWVRELPSVQPSRKGHWIDREEYDTDRWKCSECGRTVLWKEEYCPSCGAEMLEPQESEDKE